MMPRRCHHYVLVVAPPHRRLWPGWKDSPMTIMYSVVILSRGLDCHLHQHQSAGPTSAGDLAHAHLRDGTRDAQAWRGGGCLHYVHAMVIPIIVLLPPPATRSDGGRVGGTWQPPMNSDPTIWEARVPPPPPLCSSDLAATLPLPTLPPPPPPPLLPLPRYSSLCLRTARSKSSCSSGLDVPFPQMATSMLKRIPDAEQRGCPLPSRPWFG